MIAQRRTWAGSTVAVVAIWALASAAMAQDKPSTLDTAKAKAFVGEWVLTVVQGGRGVRERPLTIRDVGGKVAAELSGGQGGPVPAIEISMQGSDLILKFNQAGREGMVEIVMRLTLKDGLLSIKQDVGAQSTTGTGKRK